MIIRGLDANGDWVYGIGLNAYKTKNDAIMQNIATKLREWVGDCFFNLPAGIDWLGRIADSDVNRLQEDARILILKCYGVVAINSLSLTVVNRQVLIAYDVQTTFSSAINAITSIN